MSSFDYSRFRKGNALKTEVARKALVDLRGWKCEECGLTTWRDKKIPLQIHHKDGNHINNELDNLLLLCPNCHAQTDNYAGRNKQRRLNLSEEEFVALLKDSYSIRDALFKKEIYYSSKYHYDMARKLIEKYDIVFKQRPTKNKKSTKQKQSQPQKYCLICKKPLDNNKNIYCSQECSHKAQQKAEKPAREELKQLIRTKPFTQIGQAYNVTDNAIRKWCKNYNLPFRKKDIMTYSDEEWKIL